MIFNTQFVFFCLNHNTFYHLKAIAVACGSYHSVILLDNGQVLTFGNYQKGQLGRDAPQDDVGGASALNTREELAIRKLWFAYPDVIPDIGSDRGKNMWILE